MGVRAYVDAVSFGASCEGETTPAARTLCEYGFGFLISLGLHVRCCVYVCARGRAMVKTWGTGHKGGRVRRSEPCSAPTLGEGRKRLRV